jgi:hypothetical protein
LREGLPIPDKFANAPELKLGLELYYDAYSELVSYQTINPERPPILWADVHEYAKHHGFTSEQRDNLLYFVRELELVATRHYRKSMKGKSGKQSKPPVAKNVRT